MAGLAGGWARATSGASTRASPPSRPRERCLINRSISSTSDRSVRTNLSTDLKAFREGGQVPERKQPRNEEGEKNPHGPAGLVEPRAQAKQRQKARAGSSMWGR